MFDNEKESKIVDENDNGKESKGFKPQTVMMLIAAVTGILSVVLVLAIQINLFSGGNNPDTKPDSILDGLQSPNHLTNPDRITAQDIEDEYQSRPEMDYSVPDMLETSTRQFLSKGDFTGLDAFLAEQMSQYKNMEGDEGQSMEDWRDKFEMLRSDTVKAINIRKDSQPEVTFTQFSSPEILAAAVAWSPVSVKLDIFGDWSSLILPVPKDQDIFLRVYDLENPNKVLEEINDAASDRYYDFAAYDMTISGYNLRLYIVGDQYGYYRPWSLFDQEGKINQEMWTKSSIMEVKNELDPWSNLDSVLGTLSVYSGAEGSSASSGQGSTNENIIPLEGQESNDEEPEYLTPETNAEDGAESAGEDASSEAQPDEVVDGAE